MGTIIICTIIVALLMSLENIWDIFLGGVLGFFIGIFAYLLIGGIIGYGLATNEIIEEQEIFALNDSSSIEGKNYLFSGYIDEKMVYRYVVETEKGKHIEEVDARRGYIKEGDYTPMVKYHYYTFEKEWYNWFVHNAFTDKYYEFYVPENTITTEYNVDLD